MYEIFSNIEGNDFRHCQKKYETRYQGKAKELIKALVKENSISWQPNGKLIIDDQEIPDTDIAKIFPKVFFGLRNLQLPGEALFFKKLEDLNLFHFVNVSLPFFFKKNLVFLIFPKIGL